MGRSETACEVQGYFDETDGGQCLAGTCLVLAFDTNGARLACCTSIVSGPGMCADGGGLGQVDATVTDAEADAVSASGDSGPEGEKRQTRQTLETRWRTAAPTPGLLRTPVWTRGIEAGYCNPPQLMTSPQLFCGPGGKLVSHVGLQHEFS